MIHGLQHRVAAEVRAELARQRKPQRVLADRLGISTTQVSKRLSGEIPFDVAELDKVADELGVSVVQLLPAA
jgi:transcriptional regulator with XRE-family HTH domain